MHKKENPKSDHCTHSKNFDFGSCFAYRASCLGASGNGCGVSAEHCGQQNDRDQYGTELLWNRQKNYKLFVLMGMSIAISMFSLFVTSMCFDIVVSVGIMLISVVLVRRELIQAIQWIGK